MFLYFSSEEGITSEPGFATGATDAAVYEGDFEGVGEAVVV
ncbi:hypothetical protein [Arthrobacter sp. KNU40]